ncbi:transcription-repair coupling factor [candidate division WOR-3 bacterium]|uniref:Transcription-repair-coupling factor n=1 Tax=candidate division WOR-3 bacterium TaxID=2052148 RepID=A0A937XCM9_UNCW3|nr:transcription-repair coupling factor [candidate division WOR-3 bacterium]
MHELLERFSRSALLPALAERLAAGAHTGISGVVGAARSMLAADVAQRLGRTVVLVPDDAHAARALHLDLETVASDLNLLFFEPDSPRLPAQLATLGSGPGVIVASAESLNKPAPVWEQGVESRESGVAGAGPLSLALNRQMEMEKLISWLEENGYERTDLVTEPGEYATRGGIADIFAEGAEAPVRVEFLGDSIASLRRFDPLLQRSVSHIEAASIPTRKQPGQSDQPASTLLPRNLIIITEGTEFEAHAVLLLSTEPDAEFVLGCTPAHSYLGNIELLRSEIFDCRVPNAESPDNRQSPIANRQFLWFVAASTDSQRSRLSSIIGAGPHFFTGALSAGFICEPLGFGLLTEREIYGTPVFHPPRRRFKGLPIDNIVSLRPGDYVVHIDYGIGSFEGTRRMTHADVEKDYIVVAYAGGDKVYVPVENIGLLDRYVGSEGVAPALDRLGGRSWLHAKAKAARASAEYAEELLQIYARRATACGVQFGQDNKWQTELEASFPYEETPDQLKVMDEVKRDMEAPRPMDRLICGDVGYGKTEIALRAAFKAASNLKQVAVLAPTTILCYQHYATFKKRLARFPLRVEMLSRLVSPATQREVLAGLKSGVVDIVVGTHQLLNSAVAYHDLGLLIIDEEQKFGVKQKERIRSARAEVDVLTLTATPIPRTLYMSLSGLRDISQMHTAPPGRREITTEVAPWHDRVICDYVARELARGGQVFFVHNEIETINEIAERLQRILPGTRFAIAHGQMSGRHMADVYLGFASGEYQMLLCTAIIESGLDLPNVNTIIVNRADKFGLSDLHQLRGRVGRSEAQAYALFLTPARREVTEDARKRLSALLAYSKLGSGFKLAIRDMEIRGVGNLLGTEQHGQVARVGFTLYTQMLKEAVARIKGEPVAIEPELSLDVSAYIPKEYVSDGYERVALYKRLLAVESEPELEELRAELVDRFGRYPAPVETLFLIALVRVRSRKLGLLKVSLKNHVATIVRADRTFTAKGGIGELLDWLKGKAEPQTPNAEVGR